MAILIIWKNQYERETLTNETLQTTIKNMTEAVDRLKRYVECVKDIQKMEDIEIKKDNYNLKELIADITKEFSILAARENKKLVIRDFQTLILYRQIKRCYQKF